MKKVRAATIWYVAALGSLGCIVATSSEMPVVVWIVILGLTGVAYSLGVREGVWQQQQGQQEQAPQEQSEGAWTSAAKDRLWMLLIAVVLGLSGVLLGLALFIGKLTKM